MPSPQPTVIRGEDALAEFRQSLTGERAFDLLDDASGKLLVQLPVGVGKSFWMDKIIEHALSTARRNDLVIVLVPRLDILNELKQRLRRLRLPRPFVLRSRPRQDCGELNQAWEELEKASCGLLGRESICNNCPLRQSCRWLKQYASLRGKRLVLATQQHLVINCQFVRHLCQHTGSQRPLVLVDESDLFLRSGERVISREQLDLFIAAQEGVLVGNGEATPEMHEWFRLSRSLAVASTENLREWEWSFPIILPDWANAVQKRGRERAGADFRFLAYDLRHLALSDQLSRQSLSGGGLRFATAPDLGKEFIVFSGSIAPELLRYRLDPNHEGSPVLSPFRAYRFEHPGTRWYNLCWQGGAASYFPNNSAAILDFFAEKIARNIREDKRTLLVARKMFRNRCKAHLEGRLRELGVDDVRVVTGPWRLQELRNPRVLPLITYGISGVNLFEDFEAVYCLTSYYTNQRAVEQVVYDVDGSADHFPITIRHGGFHERRRACVELPDDRETILPRIAQWVLDQKEADVVVQAVGRVRPFTRPREVITFQMGTLPGIPYRLSFRSMAEARDFFGIRSRRQADMESNTAQARQLRSEGVSTGEIARRLGRSTRTVRRYLRVQGGHQAYL